MAPTFPLVVDATAGVVTKVNSKEVFYFAIVFYNKNIRIEPVPVFELLTDCPDEDSFTFCLKRFLRDVKLVKNDEPSIPLIAICDFSWVIMKSLLTCFNEESLNEYVERCYIIVTRMAKEQDLSIIQHLLVLHMCLAHVMKFVSFQVRKRFRNNEDKSFILYCISCLVNSTTMKQFKENLTDLLTILLSSDAENLVYVESIKNFEGKIDELNIEKYDDAEMKSSDVTPLEEDDDPRDPEQPIAKCKRSKFYLICKKEFERLTKLPALKKAAKSDSKNPYKSVDFAKYFMNHVVGLAPLWTKLMLGDLGRHGSSAVYEAWSSAFGKVECITNPTQTQAIIEKHNDSLKHVYLKRKKGRLDEVIDDLSLAKISLHRQYALESSKVKNTAKKGVNKESSVKNLSNSPKKVHHEKWGKRKSSQGSCKYQQPKIKREKIAPKTPFPETWTFSSIMKWGGEVQVDENVSRYLINTCTVDNFLMIPWGWYKEHTHFLTTHLKDTESDLLDELEGIVSLMLTEHYSEARLKLFGMSRDLDCINRVINTYDADYAYSMAPLMPLYARTCKTFCTMSEHCGQNDGKRTLTSMTLNLPAAHENSENLLHVAINDCINGGSPPVCPYVYDDIPVDGGHTRIITIQNVDKYACNGTQIFSEVAFKSAQPPPLLQFDVSIDLVDKINNLNQLPKMITAMNEDYALGGCVVGKSGHFVAYIYHSPSDSFFYYDGLHPEHFGKILNLFLKTYQISMLCYFRRHHFDKTPGDGTDNPGVDKTSSNANPGEDADPETEKVIDEILQTDSNPYAKSYKFRSRKCRRRSMTPILSNDISSGEESEESEESVEIEDFDITEKIEQIETAEEIEMIKEIKGDEQIEGSGGIDNSGEHDPDGPLIVKIPLEKIKLKKSVDEHSMTDSESGDSDDSYTRTLHHHSHCKTSSKELVGYRQIDRNIKENKSHMDKMGKYIRLNGDVPAPYFSKIMLAVDDTTLQTVLWDGNHRISCIAKMKAGFPEYVPVDFVRMNLDSIEGIDGVLHKVPTMPKTWPSYPCGCHFGFNTNIEQ